MWGTAKLGKFWSNQNNVSQKERVILSTTFNFQEIEKKYPGFIHMKLLQGIKLSFRLQQIVQKNPLIVRGFRQKEGELPSALNGFLYSILKTTKVQRRAILTSLLKQFDDTAVRLPCTICIV